MPRDSSSVCVLPTMVAPALVSHSTTGAVRSAGGCRASQSGLPPPVTCPAMSKRSFAAKVSPDSGPSAAPSRRAVAKEQKAPKGSRMVIEKRRPAERKHVLHQLGEAEQTGFGKARPDDLQTDRQARSGPAAGD